MNLAQIDIAPVCPWKNQTEWLTVYQQVLSSDQQNWRAALHTMSRWMKLQCAVPAHIAASIPVLRARCLMHASCDDLSISSDVQASITSGLLVKWAVRIAVIEFVNIFIKGVEAEGTTKSQQATLLQLAEEAGLPEELIPLRNELVHSTDVAANLFREQEVVACMWHFLKAKYWDTEHLVLRRRQEMLGHAERRCSSVVTATDELRAHVAAILAALCTTDLKTGLSGAPLFLRLKEITTECLECVQVFTSEGKVRDRDTRAQEVVRVIVEDLLLAPAFVKCLHQRQNSCTCGCPLHIDRFPLKKFLVYLLTQAPHSDLLCRDAGFVENKRKYYRQAVSLGNHLLCVLLEHVVPGSSSRQAALEWLQLLVSNCAPHSFPPSTSPLKCPHHNLFLGPVQLGEVQAPQTDGNLRGDAMLQLHWSAIVWRMLSSDVCEVTEEAVRLLPVCLAAAEQLEGASSRPAENREAARLRMMCRVLETGGQFRWKEYNLIFPDERAERKEVRAEGWQKRRARSMALLQQRQLVSCGAGGDEAKPCLPFGHTVSPSKSMRGSVIFPHLATTPEDKENSLSTVKHLENLTSALGSDVAASSTDRVPGKPTNNNHKFAENARFNVKSPIELVSPIHERSNRYSKQNSCVSKTKKKKYRTEFDVPTSSAGSKVNRAHNEGIKILLKKQSSGAKLTSKYGSKPFSIGSGHKVKLPLLSSGVGKKRKVK